MGTDTGICMGEEFATLDFNSRRLEKRFIKTMETLAGQLDKAIWFCSENRAEASETKFPRPYIECWIMTRRIGMRFSARTGKRPFGA